jgi:uncharacterized protein (TIGR02284 family)
MKALFMTVILTLSAQSFAATQLDDLIRGEMAAVKTYKTALEKVKDPKEVKKLKAIQEDHSNAVTKLKTFANKEVKEDTESAGPWGAFAKAYTGGAKLFGNETALKALKQGEEHGINEYQEALEDDSIKPELKQMIRTQFLPKQKEHINTLKTFM